MFDVASDAGLEKHNEDFGQTLGRWGMGTGPYVVLPILGPSDVRDGFSLLVVDWHGDPLWYVSNIPTRNELFAAHSSISAPTCSTSASCSKRRRWTPMFTCAAPTCSAAAAWCTTVIRRAKPTRTRVRNLHPAAPRPRRPRRSCSRCRWARRRMSRRSRRRSRHVLNPLSRATTTTRRPLFPARFPPPSNQSACGHDQTFFRPLFFPVCDRGLRAGSRARRA